MFLNEKNFQTDVMIIGAGLTGLALAYYLRKAGVNVLIVEQSERIGGVICSISEDEFTFEAGTNAGIINSAELVQLSRDLNIEIEIPDSKRKSYWVWKEDNWHALPSGLFSTISTSLFTFKDKIRILKEPFQGRDHRRNESVERLFKRRLGRSFFKYVVDPFISAIYAGDPEKLCVRFALPEYYALEREYGSIVWGSIKRRKGILTDKSVGVTKSFFSVKGGIEHLIRALLNEVGEKHVFTGVTNVRVEPIQGKYACQFKIEGDSYEVVADKLISTIDGLSIASLFPFIPEEVVGKISTIRYAKVIQVVAGYKNWKGIPLNVFAGLVPSNEEKDILGIFFPSSIFRNRAPENGALISVSVGGIKRPDLYLKTDEELIDIVLENMKEMLQCTDKPDLIRVFRYEKGIPQYEFNTKLRLFTIQEVEKAYPGLILAGNMRDGIGISDRVKQAKEIVDNLLM